MVRGDQSSRSRPVFVAENTRLEAEKKVYGIIREICSRVGEWTE